MERSPGHFELRAYNAATGKQVTKTYAHPRRERGIGIAEAKKRLARLVSDIAEGQPAHLAADTSGPIAKYQSR
jgi:hypothetical protein